MHDIRRVQVRIRTAGALSVQAKELCIFLGGVSGKVINTSYKEPKNDKFQLFKVKHMEMF